MINKVSKPKSSKTVKAKKAVQDAVAGKSNADSMSVDQRHPMERRRIVTGTVISDKMTKTVVVKVDRRVRDNEYKKYVTISKRYNAHDEGQTAKVGDLVEMVESRPLSRTKRWVVTKIVRKGSGAQVLDI